MNDSHLINYSKVNSAARSIENQLRALCLTNIYVLIAVKGLLIHGDMFLKNILYFSSHIFRETVLLNFFGGILLIFSCIIVYLFSFFSQCFPRVYFTSFCFFYPLILALNYSWWNATSDVVSLKQFIRSQIFLIPLFVNLFGCLFPRSSIYLTLFGGILLILSLVFGFGISNSDFISQTPPLSIFDVIFPPLLGVCLSCIQMCIFYHVFELKVHHATKLVECHRELFEDRDGSRFIPFQEYVSLVIRNVPRRFASLSEEDLPSANVAPNHSAQEQNATPSTSYCHSHVALCLLCSAISSQGYLSRALSRLISTCFFPSPCLIWRGVTVCLKRITGNHYIHEAAVPFLSFQKQFSTDTSRVSAPYKTTTQKVGGPQSSNSEEEEENLHEQHSRHNENTPLAFALNSEVSRAPRHSRGEDPMNACLLSQNGRFTERKFELASDLWNLDRPNNPITSPKNSFLIQKRKIADFQVSLESSHPHRLRFLRSVEAADGLLDFFSWSYQSLEHRALIINSPFCASCAASPLRPLQTATSDTKRCLVSCLETFSSGASAGVLQMKADSGGEKNTFGVDGHERLSRSTSVSPAVRGVRASCFTNGEAALCSKAEEIRNEEDEEDLWDFGVRLNRWIDVEEDDDCYRYPEETDELLHDSRILREKVQAFPIGRKSDLFAFDSRSVYDSSLKSWIDS
eukprot:GDKJ01032722.1.p1 GENE.GDKJ01032722.1~~GDKJ01032722.1.p1  ORF type:complete len:686 (+),score=101.13 GDKJ01032722.1:31-2088(+)